MVLVAPTVDRRHRRAGSQLARLVIDLLNESPKVLPDVTATAPAFAGPERPPFVLGVDGQAVAWTHGHGAAMWVR